MNYKYITDVRAGRDPWKSLSSPYILQVTIETQRVRTTFLHILTSNLNFTLFLISRFLNFGTYHDLIVF